MIDGFAEFKVVTCSSLEKMLYVRPEKVIAISASVTGTNHCVLVIDGMSSNFTVHGSIKEAFEALSCE